MLQTLNQYNKATTVNYSKECKDVITKLFKIYIIRATPFILLIKKRDYKIFTITINVAGYSFHILHA